MSILVHHQHHKARANDAHVNYKCHVDIALAPLPN